MINGFTGTGLNELVGALSRSKYGQQSPPRNIQPMPRADTVQFSARGRELAASTEVARPATPAERPATERPTSEMSMLDRMKAAFLTRQGDSGFDASLDLNSDGKINFADLAAMRNQAGPGDELSMLDRIKAAFLAGEGDEGFDASLDLNSDGKINFADLAALRNQDRPGDELSMLDRMKAAFLAGEDEKGFDASLDLNNDGKINFADLAVLRQEDRPSGPKEMLQAMQSAFFSRTGSDKFDASVDLNGDGMVNFADLAMLRAKLAGSMTRPPAEPLTPAAPASPGRPEPVVEPNQAATNPRVDDRAATMDSIRSAFLSSAGEEAYTAAADLNGDGRINFADLAQLKTE